MLWMKNIFLLKLYPKKYIYIFKNSLSYSADTDEKQYFEKNAFQDYSINYHEPLLYLGLFKNKDKI